MIEWGNIKVKPGWPSPGSQWKDADGIIYNVICVVRIDHKPYVIYCLPHAPFSPAYGMSLEDWFADVPVTTYKPRFTPA